MRGESPTAPPRPRARRGEKNRTPPRPNPRPSARPQRAPIHDGRIHLHVPVLGQDRPVPGIEAGVLLQGLESSHDCLQSGAARIEEPPGGRRRRLETLPRACPPLLRHPPRTPVDKQNRPHPACSPSELRPCSPSLARSTTCNGIR